jgi:hypothetical protein
MKDSVAKAVCLSLATLALALCTLAMRSQTLARQQIIFAVWAAQKGKQPDTPVLDPIVIVEGSELKKLEEYNYDKQKESDEALERFEKTYFGEGQQYPLLFGGSKLGNVFVDKAVGISCVGQTAAVRTTVPVPNGQYALAATTVNGLGLHANLPRPATPAQRSAFLEVAASLLSRPGAASVAPTAIVVKDLRSTKLRTDGPDALIGSVTLLDKSGVHNLFLVLEQKNQDWETSIAAQHDAISQEDTSNVVENFVDQLDLDGDGTDEIVTISGYYESWDYSIYRNVQSKWKKVYQGGGGGC